MRELNVNEIKEVSGGGKDGAGGYKLGVLVANWLFGTHLGRELEP